MNFDQVQSLGLRNIMEKKLLDPMNETFTFNKLLSNLSLKYHCFVKSLSSRHSEVAGNLPGINHPVISSYHCNNDISVYTAKND